MNKELVGKMVFVPYHSYTREKFEYLVEVQDGRMTLIDYNGNKEICDEDEVQLREASQQEIAEDFLHTLGLDSNLSELGQKKQELIGKLCETAIKNCQNYAGNYKTL